MAYDVTITRLPMRALFDLKGSREMLSQCCGDLLPPFSAQPNRMSESGGRRLMSTGPDHWLLMAPLDDEAALAAALQPEGAPQDIAITGLSDTLTFFAVAGPEVQEVMAVATPLDLHPASFPADAATWAEAFGIKALIRRIDDGFEIAIDRSYADWFEDVLKRVVV